MSAKPVSFSCDDVENIYQSMTAQLVVTATAETPIIGGLPASREMVEHYVRKTMGVTDEAKVVQIIDRIMKGLDIDDPADIEPEKQTDELLKTKELALPSRFWREPKANGDTADAPLCVRCHMIHAGFKQAMSRIGLWSEKRGTKGDSSECAEVRAHGASAGLHWAYIRLLTPDGKPITKPETVTFRGRVDTAMGPRSIVHDCELVPEGTQFFFAFRLLDTKITHEDIGKVLGAWTRCGIGSVRSQHYGRIKASAKYLPVHGGAKARKKAEAEG